MEFNPRQILRTFDKLNEMEWEQSSLKHREFTFLCDILYAVAVLYVESPRYPHPHSVRRTYSQTPLTDTEGAIESVRIKRVEFRENIKALFPQG